MNALAWAFQNGYTPGTPARIGVFACSRAATFSRAQSVSPCAAMAGGTTKTTSDTTNTLVTSSMIVPMNVPFLEISRLNCAIRG